MNSFEKSVKIKKLCEKATASEQCLIDAVMLCVMEEVKIEFVTVFTEEFQKRFGNVSNRSMMAELREDMEKVLNKTKERLGIE